MAKFAEKYLKRERNPSLCVIDDLDRKLDLVAVHIDEGNLSSGERIFQREHRQQADAEQTGNGVDDIGSMTDLHGAFQVKTGGGKIVFEYLAVIAALFRENKALLQQTFQGNVSSGLPEDGFGHRKRKYQKERYVRSSSWDE